MPGPVHWRSRAGAIPLASRDDESPHGKIIFDARGGNFIGAAGFAEPDNESMGTRLVTWDASSHKAGRDDTPRIVFLFDLTPDGAHAILEGDDPDLPDQRIGLGTRHLVSVETGSGKVRATKEIKSLHEAEANPAGDRVLVSHEGMDVEVLVAETLEPAVTLRSPDHKAINARWSPSGKTIVTQDEGANVSVWNAATGELIRSIRGVFDASLAADPSDRHVATVDSRGTISLWEISSGTLVGTLHDGVDVLETSDFRFDGSLPSAPTATDSSLPATAARSRSGTWKPAAPGNEISPGTAKPFALSRSARTGNAWRRRRKTIRSASGTPPRARPWRP